MATLPNEILLMVFENLPYFDLKFTIPAVCKLFRDLIASEIKVGKFDIALFRDVPSDTFDPSLDYKLHPAFDLLTYNFTTDIRDVKFRRREYPDMSPEFIATFDPEIMMPPKEPICLIDSPIAHENATSPAVRYLGINYWRCSGIMDPLIANADPKNVNKERAVTVLDVMQVIVDDWSVLRGGQPRGHGMQQDEFNGFYKADLLDGFLNLHLRKFKYYGSPYVESEESEESEE